MFLKYMSARMLGLMRQKLIFWGVAFDSKPSANRHFGLELGRGQSNEGRQGRKSRPSATKHENPLKIRKWWTMPMKTTETTTFWNSQNRHVTVTGVTEYAQASVDFQVHQVVFFGRPYGPLHVCIPLAFCIQLGM